MRDSKFFIIHVHLGARPIFPLGGGGTWANRAATPRGLLYTLHLVIIIKIHFTIHLAKKGSEAAGGKMRDGGGQNW